MAKEQIPLKLKEKVFKLFNGKCYFCKKDMNRKEFLENHYHHYIPEMMEGVTNESNLVLCCYNCHLIIHSKPKLTYGEIRRTMYNLLCCLLDIIPCNFGWDDDLLAAEEELKKNKEVDENWRKLIFSMNYIDSYIGLMEKKIKIKDLATINYLISKPKNLIEFEMQEKTIEEFIKDSTKLVNSSTKCDKKKEVIYKHIKEINKQLVVEDRLYDNN